MMMSPVSNKVFFVYINAMPERNHNISLFQSKWLNILREPKYFSQRKMQIYCLALVSHNTVNMEKFLWPAIWLKEGLQIGLFCFVNIKIMSRWFFLSFFQNQGTKFDTIPAMGDKVTTPLHWGPILSGRQATTPRILVIFQVRMLIRT